MRNKTIVFFTICLSVLVAALQIGCSEPPTKIAPPTGTGKVRYVPGAVERHKGWVAVNQPYKKEGYTPLQKKPCYEKAIFHFSNAYKAMKDEGHPEHVVDLSYLVMSHRKLATVLQELGNDSGAKENFEKALQWADMLQYYHDGKQGSYYYKGHIYYLKGEYEKAEKELEKDIKIRPNAENQINVKLLETIRIKIDEKRYRVKPGKTPPEKKEKPEGR
ncbi:MAG: tetratricopeptide repeat protein [Planctomycetota bacterium]|jgi:tetratricopeptide (TPR) repeat protein